MASLEEIRSERLKKIELLREAGMNPYPIVSNRPTSLPEAVAGFDSLAEAQTPVIVAGRVMAIRGQGALAFLNIADGDASLQGMLKRDAMDEALFDLFQATVDMGDFIELEGVLFVTKRNERTVEVKGWRMLAKSLRPLPDKWHGLQDVEERFRKRYLDSLMDEQVRTRFVVRSRLIAEIRNVLNGAGFL